MHFSNLILTALVAWTPSTVAGKKKDDAVLLSKVKSLTLRDGADTTHRRVEALPQLNCVGGNAKGLYHVDTMRCMNSGSEYDAEDIQWTCKASLPPEFKLGSTDVICEGYDNSDDPFILKGSCGVEYRLILTELGEMKYSEHLGNGAWRTQRSRERSKSKESRGDGLAAVLFWIVFVGIVGVILYSIFWPSTTNGQRRTGLGGGGGGYGGNDDSNDDPPPPYTPRDTPRSTYPSTPRSAPKPKATSSTRSSSSRSSSNQQEQGWRPGFWTGTAAGTAAGYAAGSYNANRTQRNEQLRREQEMRQNYAQPGPSRWFGGGNTDRTAPRPAPASSFFGSSSRSGSSSSAPAPSSSRQESTGFGGTRRR